MTSQAQPLTEDHCDLLDELMFETPYQRNYAQHIVETIYRTDRLRQQFKDRSEHDLFAYVETNLARWVRKRSDDPLSLDLLLHETDWWADWLIEGLIERHTRTIFTGAVGAGKTEFLYQLAIQVASGIHPFTLEQIEPLRVLIVDCENTKADLGLRLRRLSDIAGSRLHRENLFFEINDSHSLDLTEPTTADWLIEKVQSLDIDLLIIGPLYKVGGGGNPVDEHTALKLATTFDELRDHCSLIIEAHTTKDGKSRLPYGAAVWQRWPEYGLHLDKKGNLSPFRPARRQGQWPTQLNRGGEWPFTIPTTETNPNTDESAAVLEFLNTRPGQRFAKTRIASEMRSQGIRKRDSVIVAALERLAADGQIEAVTEGRATYFTARPEPAEPLG